MPHLKYKHRFGLLHQVSSSIIIDMGIGMGVRNSPQRTREEREREGGAVFGFCLRGTGDLA